MPSAAFQVVLAEPMMGLLRVSAILRALILVDLASVLMTIQLIILLTAATGLVLGHLAALVALVVQAGLKSLIWV